MGFMEMHTHILPGVDDGAEVPGMALKMVWQAYRQGVDQIILTPHYHPERGFTFENHLLQRKLLNLKEAVHKKISGDIQLYMGQEINWNNRVIEKLNKKELFTMANTGYVLIEFNPEAEPGGIQTAIDQLTMAGYLPIIAHIERYRKIVGKYGLVEKLIKDGAYIQVNCQSFFGSPVDKRVRFCRKLYDQRRVHFVSSDCHDTRRRPPMLRETAAFLDKRKEQKWYQKVFFEHPKLLIRGIEIGR